MYKLFLAFAIIYLMAGLPMAAADEAAFMKSISANDVAAVRAMLAADPSLANAHNAKGTPAVSAALFINRGEGFLEPKTNEILQLILANKPKLDVFEVAALGAPGELEAIIRNNPDAVTMRSRGGWTLLHVAAYAGNLPNTELLIAKGADIHSRAKSKFLNTPMQTAMLNGQYATAKILIDHGADVLVRQSLGFTALHEAALLGRQDLVQLLLDHGAELSSMADNGETPLACAIRGKHSDFVTWMKAKGASVEAVKIDE